jgi:catechol 2,3-dioxygenase-like lactoylglutathione lyase family enzyme
MTPLAEARAITKIPATDLARARRFYSEKLGLDPVEEREGGLRYVCGEGEFHVFHSAGASAGEFTQMGWEIDDMDTVIAELRERGVEFESYDTPGLETEDGIAEIEGNYPSKGSGERGAWFRDSEGNMLGLAQAKGNRDRNEPRPQRTMRRS